MKAVTDEQAMQIGLVPIPTFIESLQRIPAPRPLPHDSRIAPVETTIHSVTATLIAYRLTPQAEIQLVLSDESRRTIVATIPSLACVAGSRFFSEIQRARTEFERWYFPTAAFADTRRAITVQGVGFFDFLQGQRGLAPNGLSLDPVTAIDLTPPYHPPAPPFNVRRRSVGSGAIRPCPRPSLSITASRGSTCSGEQVTVAWQASDPTAHVAIDGIGVALPSSGSRSVAITGSTIWSGRASTSCGSGDEATALVTLTPAATALLSGPSSVTTGNTATLSISLSGATSWKLTSSLGNTISPNSGTSSQSATYFANRTGTDNVTLTVTGNICGNATQSLTIVVIAPPSTGGLRCCDGTRSPTCFDCAKKQGCCSSHGGVCGCQ